MIREYFNAKRDAVAKISARLLRAGVIGIILAALPVYLLWRQNKLLEVQNEHFRYQNRQLERQLAHYEEEATDSRRAYLLATLYDSRCDGTASGRFQHKTSEDHATPGSAANPCHPVASSRARVEALRAFVDLERRANRVPDLGNVNLVGLDLSTLDLSGVMLARAVLTDALLNGTDFTGATLCYSDLRGATLQAGTRLRKANLMGADLRDVVLGRVDLTAANLSHANLSNSWLVGIASRDPAYNGEPDLERVNLHGADLSGAVIGPDVNLAGVNLFAANLRGAILDGRNLNQEQLASTYGDASTELPKGLEPPDSWSLSLEESIRFFFEESQRSGIWHRASVIDPRCYSNKH